MKKLFLLFCIAASCEQVSAMSYIKRYLAISLSDINLKLFSAVEKGLLEEVENLLAQGADVNAVNDDEATPLLCAAQNGYYEMCHLLIQSGARVEGYNKSETPLLCAAEKGYYPICNLLIKHRANINAWGTNCETPLVRASKNGFYELCDLLIQSGARINGYGNNKTPLMHASCRGHYNICFLLIKNGAQVNAKDHNKITTLSLAASARQPDICLLLIEHGANVNANDVKNRTPLIYASQEGLLEVCQKLLEKGAELNSKDCSKCTAFFYAARNNHLKICELFIANKDIHGISAALAVAVSRGHHEIYSLLIKKAKYLNPALRAAARDNQLEICADLIERGANINTMSSHYGTTPLHNAAKNNSPELCRLLIKSGADITVLDTDNRTALIYAAQNGQEVCKVIVTTPIFLPKFDDFNQAYQRINTALLCFKRLSSTFKINFPKNIQYLILKSAKDLQKDLTLLMILQKQKDKPVPAVFINMATAHITDYTIEQLKPLMANALTYAKSEEIKSILDPTTLELNFGEQISNHIKSILKKKEPFQGNGPVDEAKRSCIVM